MSEDCHSHVVKESKFKMIVVSGKMSIIQINELLIIECSNADLSLGFYIVSRCIHGHRHNNRVMLQRETNGLLGVEIICPHLGMFFKVIRFCEFSNLFLNPGMLVSDPEKQGFAAEEM